MAYEVWFSLIVSKFSFLLKLLRQSIKVALNRTNVLSKLSQTAAAKLDLSIMAN